jgi:hypothetical protein
VVQRTAIPQEAEDVLAKAVAELAHKTQLHSDSWGIRDVRRADVDIARGTLSFASQKGWFITTRVQIVGTFTPADKMWLWAWDNPSIPPALAENAQLVRDFGKTYGLAHFQTRKISATEDGAWSLTALACHLAGNDGAYRGTADNAQVFMNFRDVSIFAPN